MSLAKEQESLISLENINMALAQWQTRTVLCFCRRSLQYGSLTNGFIYLF